ncbi:glycoside hydrolase family 3 protein [Massilia sp. TSP1-1-2]
MRESLVLLKNDGNALPLAPGKKILVVGKGADSLPLQNGGWTLTWQGTDNKNGDFPNGDTILAGIVEKAGAANVTYSHDVKGIDVAAFDAVIAVIGETPYAEGAGDIGPAGTLRHSARYPEDLEVLKAVGGKGKPVVTVLLSGRPVYANDLMNLSDSFVAAWLPGTEGKGIADVLFTGVNSKGMHSGGGHSKDSHSSGRRPFSGTWSFAWPGSVCQTDLSTAGKDSAPLFKLGYGLRYGSSATVG